MTRSRAGLIALVVLSVSCSLARSFDGLSDEWGKPDAAADVVLDVSDARADVPDGHDVPDVVDGPPLCTVETLWDGGSVTTAGATYLHGLTIAGDSIYVVGGNYQDNNPQTNTKGFVKRIAKAPPHASYDVATGLFRPRSIAFYKGALLFGSGPTLLRVDANAGPDAGGTPVTTTVGAVYDLHAADGGVYFIAGANQANATVGYLPDGDGAGATTQVYPNANRVVTTSSFTFVGRVNDVTDSAGLQRVPSDGGFPRCVLQGNDAITTMASDGSRVFWGSAGDSLVAQPIWWSREGECPIRTPRAYDLARSSHLAANGSELFIGYKEKALLYRLDETSAYCTVSLPSAESQGVSATQNAKFDGDWVYFLTPVAVRRMRAR